MPSPTTSGPVSFVPLTGDNYIDSLLNTTKWGGAAGTSASITYSFPGFGSLWSTDSTVGYGPITGFGEPWGFFFSPLTSTEQMAAQSALQKWANVATITFVQSQDDESVVGDIRFAWTDNNISGQAHAYFPSPDVPAGGDIWLNVFATDWGNFAPGSYGYNTLLHEVGHAIGLKHPFSSSGSNSTTLSANDDFLHNTIMSYSPYVGAPAGVSWTFSPTTPMPLDIKAAQYLYGPNNTYHAGNDTYTYFQGQDYFETIWDAGGTDTIVYSGSDHAEIDLRPGAWSNLGNTLFTTDFSTSGVYSDYTVAIYETVTIENATGGNGADLIYGNNVANSLQGNSGNDTLIGGGGNDTMAGGTGNDQYTVGQAGDVVTELSGEGTDTVKSSVTHMLGANVEKLTLTGTRNVNGTGNNLPNTITGNSGNNTLNGSGGNDTLNGGAGNDTLNGGTGNDSMTGGTGNDTYTMNTAGDTIKELANQGTDTVKSSITHTLAANVEKLVLTGSSNINGTGNGLPNTITGNSGNNILNGGGGNDTMIGGAGNDTYVVNTALDVVTELAGGGADTIRSTATCTLSANVENLLLTGAANINGTGNAESNEIFGNDGNNILAGLGGNDLVDGAGGNDTVLLPQAFTFIASDFASHDGSPGLAGTGALISLGGHSGSLDDYRGGAGIDTLQGSSSANAILLDYHSASFQIFSGFEAIDAGDGDDIVDLTSSRFGYGDVSIIGGAGNDVIWSSAGNDTLDGGGGNDTLDGWAGDDTLVWDAADGSIQGGLGTDTLRVDGAGVQFDLTAIANNKIVDVEIINFTGGGNNTLTLALDDVLALSSTTDILRVDGNAGDVVNAGSGWTQDPGPDQVIGTQTYETYTQGAATLLVDTDITGIFI